MRHINAKYRSSFPASSTNPVRITQTVRKTERRGGVFCMKVVTEWAEQGRLPDRAVRF